jgi:hypothetical protein
MQAHDESLNLFYSQPVNSGIIQSQIIQHLPISSISNGCIEFNVTSQNYIDLSKSSLYLKCKVLKDGGEDITYIPKKEDYKEEGDVGITNALFGSLFSKVDLSIQQHPVSNDIPNYCFPYKYMLDKLLTTKTEADESILFFKDDSKGIECNSIWSADDTQTHKDNNLGNSGFKQRLKFIDKSQNFELESPIGLDFLNQKRLLIHNTNIQLKFWQSSPQFHIISIKPDQKFYVKILEAKLNLCHVTLDPAVNVAIADSLKIKPAQYPFKDSKIRCHTIAKGSGACTITDLFGNECPDELYVCMVDSKSFHGVYKSNPFAFKPFKISEIGYYVNNIALPANPLKLNFGASAYESNYLEAWQRLKDINPDSIISFEDFYRGYSIFSFNINRGKNFEELLPNSTSGSTKLELRFSTPLPDTIVLLLYGRFKSVLTIDGVRNISVLSK